MQHKHGLIIVTLIVAPFLLLSSCDDDDDKKEMVCGGGATDCFMMGSWECEDQDGCHMGGSSIPSMQTCSGIATSCRSYRTEASCNVQKGCRWQEDD